MSKLIKTLVAEDDKTSCSTLVAFLRKIGFDPIIADNGTDAWKAMQQTEAPRLIFLDWNMPGLDGAELCRRIRQRNTSDPPYIIMLSARDSVEDVVSGLDTGASDYITKPYHFAVLQARLMVGKRTLDLQSSLLQARNMLKHQAMHDALTGVFNRGAILENLTHELSRTSREHQSLHIGMYDIDHFKRVNDTYGHQVGDEILVGLVRRIQKHTRDYTAIGRYGGEEFIVIISGPTEALTDAVHERLRATVAGCPFETSAGDIAVTVSAGVAWARSDSTRDSLIGEADMALYTAKQSGRNRVARAKQ